MDFAAFVETHRLRLRRDSCGDPIVAGELGHIYPRADGRFGMVFEDAPKGPGRAWTLLSRRRKALAAGFASHQPGDAEAALLFDPGDAGQARLAIRLVGAKRRPLASPDQLRALKASRESRLNQETPRIQRASAA